MVQGKNGKSENKSGKRERKKEKDRERRLSKQHVNEMQIKCGNRIRTRTVEIKFEVDSWWLTPVCSLFSFNISFACTVHLFAYLFVGVWSALPLVDFRLNTSRIFAWFTRRCTQTLTPSSHSSISLSLSIALRTDVHSPDQNWINENIIFPFYGLTNIISPLPYSSGFYLSV